MGRRDQDHPGTGGPHVRHCVASGQLFVNTSFVLSYPKVGGAIGKPWSFCKLQVRRVVDVIGVGQKAGASDWSPAAWVQLLPDFDLYSANSVQELDL